MTSRGRINKSLNPDYVRGILAAADFADDYNGSSLHKYMLGDCIALKFNVVSRKRPRPNPKAARNNNLWLAGYAAALVRMYVSSDNYLLTDAEAASIVEQTTAQRLFSIDEALASEVPLSAEVRRMLLDIARLVKAAHAKRSKCAKTEATMTRKKTTRRTRP